MAMITCGECGGSVSTEAKTCPNCGASRKVFQRAAGTKKPMSWLKKVGIAFGVMFGVSLVGGFAASVSGTKPGAESESAQDKQQKHMTYQAYLAAKAVKASLRNPDSLSFEQILANDDGSVICLTYRTCHVQKRGPKPKSRQLARALRGQDAERRHGCSIDAFPRKTRASDWAT